MRIGLAQMDIHWEDIHENMANAQSFYEKAKEQMVDILVFPEMTLTGFSMNVEVTGKRWRDQVDFFCRMSREYGILTVFGYAMPVSDSLLEIHPDWNHYHNRLGICENGLLRLSYAKIHPFTYGLEGKYYQGGDEILTLSWKDTVLGAFICYDLRFPEIFQVSSDKSEIIFVISNWPGSRVEQMDALLSARAIENQVFVVGVNRTGEGDGLIYNGHCAVYDPAGNRLNDLYEDERLITVDIDPGIVRESRERFPLKMDRRVPLYYRLWEQSMKR